MSTNTCIPLNAEGPCGSLPLGFSRLRYFFGKRLSVADFVDEQRFNLGKQRFHNQHGHGAGVLCGLGLDVFDSSVLRVGKGAALDHCGHEIIVGFDQCVDVDAWYRHQLELDPTAFDAHLDADGTLPLCVTLTYRECKTDPEPAPRDPCSCAEGGCDFGRVRETFVLELAIESEARTAATDSLFPSREKLLAAVAAPGGAKAVATALGSAVMAGCPEAPEDNLLVLGCFNAVLSADKSEVTSVERVRATPFLLSSAALQSLYLAVLAAEHGAVVLGGPEIAEMTMAQDTTVPTTYTLGLELTGSIEASSFDASNIALHHFDSIAGWSAPSPSDFTASYVELPTPTLVITIDNTSGFLVDGGRCRLSIQNDGTTPMIDSDMRPLLPRSFSRDFVVTDDAGTLVANPAPYSE